MDASGNESFINLYLTTLVFQYLEYTLHTLVVALSDHGRTTNGHSTPPLLWSNDSHRHLNMCILMRTFRWWTMSIIYNHVLLLTKERFPLLRFILADVPFQNMSLNEQYSDEEQRSSKHENCRHINWIITIFANFRKCIWPQLTVRYVPYHPCAFFPWNIMRKIEKIWL